MASVRPWLRITVGNDVFPARLQRDLSSRSCAQLEELMPYHGKVIHARWSGESFWSPLAAVWPSESTLTPENATGYPALGQGLLYAGALGEPELLIAYGPSRFAGKCGPLAGNPVFMIEDRLVRLAELGHEILWRGAMDIHMESVTEHAACQLRNAYGDAELKTSPSLR